MLLFIFTGVVYVFFIYGVIEFFKNLYKDIYTKGKAYEMSEIKILVEDLDDIEYTVSLLKKNFNNIIILINGEDEYLIENATNKVKDPNIRFEILKRRKLENS
ncbi:hypothetical protein [Dethiothermospora halolimnae]|uniref:hypothetical protein n=1 Tax=Dethiothermospora halolimnae TaxID=3114390 RepID=UPI003CCC19A3